MNVNVKSVLDQVGKGFFGVSNEEGGDEEVESLLQRVAEGVLPEDRREALQLLQDAITDDAKAQLAVGAMGLPILCEVVREERDDLEMLRGALECLCLVVPAASGGNPQRPQEAHVGPINAELFSRKNGNVAMLLALLEDEPVGVNDFYVRYHTLQLLTALAVSSHRLLEAVLASHMGVVRLMDMMNEREAIRNEALLLLNRLTRDSVDIQKIAAFEGAFERLFNIVREEGGADGGVVVQDCLELMNNLLRNNSSNQRMFRELGFLASLPALLRLQQPGGNVARQKACNLLCALETVQLLVEARSGKPMASAASAPGAKEAAENRAACQAALLKAGVLDILIGASLGDGAIASLTAFTGRQMTAQALRCLAELVADHGPAKDALLRATVAVGGAERPALEAALQETLHGRAAPLRDAAEAALQAFCRGNPDGQTMLGSTMAPVGDDDSPSSSTFGGVLVRGLAASGERGGAAVSARAARVLAHLLLDNPQFKQRVLAIPLEASPAAAAGPRLLMPRCLADLSQALLSDEGEQGRLAAALILRLLVTWCDGCPPAVGALLSTPSHLPLLVDMVAGRVARDDPTVCGLAAVLLGLCLLHNPGSSSAQAQGNGGAAVATPGADAVLDIIMARIGISQYFVRLDALTAGPQFATAAAGDAGMRLVTRDETAAAMAADDGIYDEDQPESRQRSAGAPRAQESPFDYAFAGFVASLKDTLKQRILQAYERPFADHGDAAGPSITGSTDAERMQSAIAVISQLQREASELRSRTRALAEDLLRQAPAKGSSAPSAETGHHPDGAHTDAAPARTLAEISALRHQVNSLQVTVRDLQQQLEAARQQAEDARAAVAKSEADLEDLSGAYNTLEAHAFKLEGQLREQRTAASGDPDPRAASEADIQRRIDAAVEEAQEESSESMNDLLVCLGQEEAKVGRLRAKLEEAGVDVEALLEGVGGEDEGEDDAG